MLGLEEDTVLAEKNQPELPFSALVVCTSVNWSLTEFKLKFSLECKFELITLI